MYMGVEGLSQKLGKTIDLEENMNEIYDGHEIGRSFSSVFDFDF